MDKEDKLQRLKRIKRLDDVLEKETVSKDEFLKIFNALTSALKKHADTNNTEHKDLQNSLVDLQQKVSEHDTLTRGEVNELRLRTNELIRKIGLVKAERGDNGKTPVKGVDYFTDKDKEEILLDVLSQVPNDKKELVAEEMRDLLEKLTGDERLDISAIKGFGKKTAKLSNEIINRAIGIVDQRTSFLINKISNLQSQVTNLPTASTTWYSETPTGAFDDVNKTFTLTQTPLANSLILFLNGQYLTQTVDYNLSGSTIIFASAPSSAFTSLPFIAKYQ